MERIASLINHIKTSFILLLLFVASAKAQSSCHTGKLDPRVTFVLQFMPSLTLEQERTIPVEVKRTHTPPISNPVPEDKMQHIKITTDSIPMIVFHPEKASLKQLPVIIEYHGGAFYLPLQPWMYRGLYDMANELNAIVFAVDYRVAPEHPFPAGVNDSYNAFKWLTNHAQEYGGDTSKIMLDGSSAGGNLAAVVSLMARDNGLSSKIKMVSLFCPDTDNPMIADYPSYHENAKGYGITKDNILWVTENYSSNLAKDSTDFRMFPIKAKNFKGLPPTLVYTAEFDVLRDEGIAYANKLKAAGVPVLDRCFPGQLHVLMGLTEKSNEWKQINDDTRVFMNKYLKK